MMKRLDDAGFLGKLGILAAGFFFGVLLTGAVFVFAVAVRDMACNYGLSREVVVSREC